MLYVLICVIRCHNPDISLLSVFDASAKSPQGLLFGSSYHLGNFDECVGIEDPGDNGVSITGQYCLATIKWKQRPEKKKVTLLTPKLGIS